MKVLLTTPITTYNEGQPLKQGSVNHIQSAYQEALTAIATGLATSLTGFGYVSSNPYFATGSCLAGVVGSTYVIPSSWVLYNNILYRAPGVTLTPATPPPGTNIWGTIDTTYFMDPIADPVIMSDGVTTANVHQDNIIVWSYATTGDIQFNSVSTLLNAVHAISDAEDSILTILLNNTTGPWTSFGSGGSTYGTGWVAGSGAPARFRTDWGNQVTLQGRVQNTVNTINVPMLTLPSGVAPTAVMLVPCVAFNGTAQIIGQLEIDTSGNIQTIGSAFNAAVANSSAIIYLDNISFVSI